MNRLRSHLVGIAVATLAIHAAGVAVGALRVCWGSEHTHAGVAAADCPMHHDAPAQDTHYGHHAHGDAAAPANDDGQQLACGCSSDPGSPYVGPAGIVAQVLVLSHATLEDQESRASAADAIRGLIEAMLLEPDGDQLKITLKGDLAGMLSAARDSKRSPDTGDLLLQIKMVAGGGFEPPTFGL